MSIEALRAERTVLIRDARAINDSRNPTAEAVARATAMMDKADTLQATISAKERLARAESTIVDYRRETAEVKGVSLDLVESTVERKKKLIRSMMLDLDTRSPEDTAEMVRRGTMMPNNALGTLAPAAGGYLIAPAYFAELLVAMKSQGAMRAIARNIETKTGAAATWPELDDRNQSGRLVASENIQLPASTDLVFGVGTLAAYSFVTDVLLVSNQLMQDSAFEFDDLVRDGLAGRFVRAQNPYFTTGTGTGQPQGVLTAAALGVTGATGSATSASVDNLLDLVHSVDPVYRPGSYFMVHDTTLRALRGLKDSSGRYIVQTGAASTAGALVEDTLLGYPVAINQDMPVLAANAKSILFGNFQSYVIRDVQSMQLFVLRERYADVNQTGFIGLLRSDGRLLSAATPIKYYQNSAT